MAWGKIEITRRGSGEETVFDIVAHLGRPLAPGEEAWFAVTALEHDIGCQIWEERLVGPGHETLSRSIALAGLGRRSSQDRYGFDVVTASEMLAQADAPPAAGPRPPIR